jgi:ferredoxin
MTTVKSDPTLLAEVRKYGQFDTNACLQCGSCTVVCDLTSDSAPFPRRTLRYGLLGLKEPLESSLEPWLCYYCGDCSTTCPRETDPAEAMMTLRRYLVSRYDWTGFTSKIHRSAAWRIGLLVAIGILFLFLVVFYHLQFAGMTFSEFAVSPEPLGLEHMFDKIGTFTFVVFLISLFFLLSNGVRMYWFTMRGSGRIRIPLRIYFSEIKTFWLHVFTQKRFLECRGRARWLKHGALVYGATLMFFIKFFLLRWFQTDNLYPIYHPQRWLGYLATAMIIYGIVEILVGRMKKSEEIHKFSQPTDWVFPILVLLVAVSGIAVHILRYSGLDLLCHYTYALHLAIAVPMVLVEIPFGKWSHMIYRPLAVYLLAVRIKAQQQPVLPSAVLEHAK